MPRIPESFDEDTIDLSCGILSSARIRITGQRLAILKVLQKESRPVSVERIRKELPSVNSSSVYRTVELLVEKGLASRINTGSAHASYELISGRKHHHHVVCTGCGDLEDVDAGQDCPAGKIERRVLSHSEKFTAVSSHSMEFFGLCRKCEARA